MPGNEAMLFVILKYLINIVSLESKCRSAIETSRHRFAQLLKIATMINRFILKVYNITILLIQLMDVFSFMIFSIFSLFF